MNAIVRILKEPRWSPYLVGAGIGVLSWITFGLMGKSLGASTTLVRWAGLLNSVFNADHVAANPYYAKYLIDKPALDWQMMLVAALPVGAFLSAWLARSHQVETVPSLWKWRFGPRPAVRYLGAMAGGLIMLFGARLAGGCTSGHGLSGALQLSLSGWVFFASFFVAGVITARALFGKEGHRHV